MNKNNNNIYILFFITIAIDVLLVCGSIFLWHKLNTSVSQINTLVKNIAVHKAQNRYSYEIISFIKKELQPAREQIDDYIINKHNYISFIESIEELGKHARVDINISSTELQDVFQLRVDSSGFFDNIMYFQALIETLPINLITRSVLIEKQKIGNLWGGLTVIELPGLDKKNKNI